MEGGQGKGHQGSGHKPPEEGPLAPFREGTQPLSTRMRRAVGAGSCLFWELCSGVFSGTRVLRQDPPPPRCHQGPARGRRLSPSRSGLPGACPQHLLAKPVMDACGGVLGSGNRTLETGPPAVSSGFCLLGTGLRKQASGLGSGSGPYVLGSLRCALRVLRVRFGLCAPGFGLPVLGSVPQLWFCSLSSGHQHLHYACVVSALPDSHRGERSSPPSDKLLMPCLAPPGLVHSRLPDIRAWGGD